MSSELIRLLARFMGDRFLLLGVIFIAIAVWLALELISRNL